MNCISLSCEKGRKAVIIALASDAKVLVWSNERRVIETEMLAVILFSPCCCNTRSANRTCESRKINNDEKFDLFDFVCSLM